MSFGFNCKGANGQTIIDENNGALMITQEGTVTGASNGTVTVAFNAATSVSIEPPMVFVNPSASNGFSLFQIYGSPGAWTYFTASGDANFATMTYFIGVKNTIPSPMTWGMRIFNAAGLLVYDSGYKIANFLGAIGSWSYAGRYQTGNNLWYHVFTGYYPWGNAYYLLNNFGIIYASSNNDYDYTLHVRNSSPPSVRIELGYVISTSQPIMTLPMVVARILAA